MWDFSLWEDGFAFPTNGSVLLPCEPILAYSFGFVVALRVCVSITCVLSMFGAGLIIGTFVAFKELRTKARKILVQLSIADFIVALSHLLGVNINLPKFTEKICSEYEESDGNITSDLFCQVQGGITVFSTVGSYFWTIAVAYYLLVIIVFESQRVAKWLVYVSYPVCWGIPTVLVFVLGFLKYLGFRPNLDSGWCYVNEGYHHEQNHVSAKVPEIFSQIFVYLNYILLPVIYIWIRCHIRFKLKRVSKKLSISDKLQTRTRNADIKLTFIPLIFLFLRLWGTILGVHYIYLTTQRRKDFSRTTANAVLMLLSSIGSSAQGLMNALLFCVFTKVIRNKLVHHIKYCVCRICLTKADVKVFMMEPSTCHTGIDRSFLEDTTQYEDGQRDEECMREHPSDVVAVNNSFRPRLVSDSNATFKSRLLSDSLSGLKYHSLSIGKSSAPE